MHARTAVLALLLAFAAILGASCVGTPPPPELTAAEILAQASQKVKALQSLHFKLESQGAATLLGGGLGLDSAEGDVVKPDKVRVTVKASFLGQPVELGFISLGNNSYVTNPLTGKWEATAAGVNPLGFFDPGSGAASILDNVKNPEKLANETLDGTTAYHLRGTVPTSALTPMVGSAVEAGDVKVEVWVGTGDLLPRQFRLDGAVMPGEPPGIVRTLTLSRFDQPATIEAPQ